MIQKSSYNSPLGILTILTSDSALTHLSFGNPHPDIDSNAADQLHQKIHTWLNLYFDGNVAAVDFEMIPEGTVFQQRVWNELQNIPYGSTISYRQLAQRLGDEKVIRAAASANGANPIAILIPCHRVIGSDGSMTGYAGGVENKIRLLQLEGAMLF
ncbi:MAG: methylated-DNA--[protein]-cysteine S-methyltransferase [Bacteroidia bacterium]